jgi:hypothetical protein
MLPPEKILFIPKTWRKIVTKKSGYCDYEACVLLADLVNPYWIKTSEGEVVGINTDWQPVLIDHRKFKSWAETLKINGVSAKRLLSSLVELNLLVKVPATPEQIKEMICQKQPQAFKASVFTNTCEWCECQTGYLHEHHYPVRRSQGGIETVSICPNCHSEYHTLEHLGAYLITDKVLECDE